VPRSLLSRDDGPDPSDETDSMVGGISSSPFRNYLGRQRRCGRGGNRTAITFHKILQCFMAMFCFE
jgi:hypothetical protein